MIISQVTPVLRVLFVCRGSVQDGFGHVMRSRTVALQMAVRNSVRVVVIGDHHAETFLFGCGLDYEVIASDGLLGPILKDLRPHVVVFDMIDFPESAFLRICQHAMTVGLSPIFNCLEHTDLFFNRTIYTSPEYSFHKGKPVLRSGLEYAVVRGDCIRIPEAQYRRNLEQEPLSVVISMGGADAGNKTLQVLKGLRSVPNPMLFWVMLGEGYAHSYEALVDCMREDSSHEIVLAKTNNSMWRIMSSCTVGILAGGTVSYEAAYAGLPSINFFDVGTQTFLTRELEEAGVCLNAGYPLSDAIAVVRANVIHLEGLRSKLLEMHLSSQELIDGLGAQRIARETEQFYWDYFARSNECNK